MADNDTDIRLGFQADTEALTAAQRAIQSYIATLQGLAKASEDANKSEKETNATLKEVQAQINATERASNLKGLAGEFGTLAGDVGDTSKRVDELTAALEKLGATQPEIKAAVDEFLRAKDAAVNDVPDLASLVGGGSEGDSEGGGGIGGKLGRTGSKIRALPSTQIPGLGIGTDAIGNILRLGSVIDDMSKISIGAAGGIALASAALMILAHNAAEAKKAAQEELDARARAITLLQEGTRADIEARKAELEQKRITNAALVADARDLDLKLRQAAVDQFGEAAVRIQETLAATVGANSLPELQAAKENYDKLTKAANESDTELVLLTQGLAMGAGKTNDLTAATEAAAKAQEEYNQRLYEFAQEALTSAVDTQEKIADLIKSGSEQQLNELIASTQKQVDATKLKIQAEYDLAEQYKDDIPHYNEIGKEIEKLQAQQTNYQNSLDELSNSMVRAYVVANDSAEKQKEIEADSAKSYEKYLTDTQKIEDTWQDSRLKAADKYQSKLTDIAAAAVKASEDLLQKLEQKRDDIRTKFEQSETDAETSFQQSALDRQIKFQRTEAQAAEQHQRDIQKIIKDAQDKEHDLVLNRDFSGLFDLKRQTNKQIEDANQNYDDQRKARLEAFRNENDDAQRHFIEDEQQRQVQYERQLQQAQIQYQREYAQAAKNRNDALQKAAEAYSKELELASQKHQKELLLRQQSEVAELQLIQQGNAQKLQLEQQYYQQSIALLNAATARSGQEVLGGSHASLDSPNTGSSRSGIGSSTHNYGNSIGTVNYSPAIKGNDDERIAQIAGDVLEKVLGNFLN